MSDAGHPGLIRKIRDEIERKGPIPFARFMEMALYDPEGGYYTTGGDRIGLGGDYYTSPDVHPIFGRLLAKQMREMAGSLDRAGPLTILEMGAGKGLLGRDILAALRENFPGDFKRWRYGVIERSPAMVGRQRELLGSAGLLDSARWYGSLKELRSEGPLRGVVLSNELLDAFPVHRVIGRNGRVEEYYVDWKGDRFIEVPDRPSTPEIEQYLTSVKVDLSEGQRAELNLEAASWMREVAGLLDRGFVITIDYGHPASELFAPHRMKGSLLCYYRHTVNEDPFSRVGEQDITAHVDFTRLAQAGLAEGLEPTGFTNQLNFLMGLGVAQEMERLDPTSRELAAAKRLLARESMGGVFKVLIQQKGIKGPLALEGLSFRPFFNDALGL